jgi:hypothetical protein
VDPIELPEETQAVVASLPCRSIHPYTRNENFIGREEIISDIARALAPGIGRRDYRKIFTICGVGGVGKTQTALSYVYSHMEDFQAVLWTHASTRGRLLDCFASFALELGLISGEGNAVEDKTSAANVLLRWLNTTGTAIYKLTI